MYSSSDLIAALLARGRRRLSLRERARLAHAEERAPGEFPPGWKAWLGAMRERVGAVTGATADAFLAILVQREPSLPPKAGRDLTRWQTFATLWRSSWEPPERDSRGDRVVAGVATLFVHLAMLVLWAWLIYVRVPPAAAPADKGDSVVQVEFIGEGTPEETGGGAPTGETDAPQQAGAPDTAAAPAEAEPVAVADDTPPQPQPEPEQPSEAIARQPLQVSETAQPEARFVLPPTTPPELEALPVERPQATVVPRERSIELVERPTPPVVRVEVAPRPIDVPAVRPAEQQVRQREIPLLAPPRALPDLSTPSRTAQRIEAPERAVRGREITLEPAQAGEGRAQAVAPTSGTASAPSTSREGAQPAADAAAPGGRPEAGGERPAAAAGSGAEPAAAPGAWPTPQRGDDWGEALRNRPGGNAGTDSGLFDADGRPRLPPGTAAPGGGFPPGSDDWTRDQLDRHGTWATRPPLGYEPTRFDRYWIPSGTLLEEWVRRGIKSMAIPIPGTTKKILCTISILQLGGGCGISDPNLQDQEATARPPPDVPFKPELQEDQDALGRP